ncbi:MAG: ABC transporter permease [Candidatus Anstonellales archaeon]
MSKKFNYRIIPKEFFTFFFNELKNIFEIRYLLSILITLLITIALSNTMLDISKSFKEGELGTALPIVSKLATVGIYNTSYSEIVNELEKSNSLHVIKYSSLEQAYSHLKDNKIHAILIVDTNSSTLILGNNKMNTFIEQIVRTTLDNHFRKDKNNAFELKDDVGLEELLKGILLPIMLFSPLFLFSIPIIQSIAYDRENRIIEILYSLNINKKYVYLGKLLAAIFFSAIMCFLWLLIMNLFGYTTYNFIEVFIIVVCIAALIVSINGMISTISSTVQEASLSASIVSTVIFVILFGSMLFKLVKPLEGISNLTPTTYISSSVSSYQKEFPVFPFLLVIVMTLIFALMGTAAFTTERFAFSQKPGIDEIFTGTLNIISNNYLRRFIAALFSYVITIPVQVMLVLTIFFLGFSIGFQRFFSFIDIIAILAIITFSFSEELMKGYSIRALIFSKINKQTTLENHEKIGLIEGFFIGFLFGLFELVTFFIMVKVSPEIVISRLLFPRIIALLIHVISSIALGIIYSKYHNFKFALAFASLIHSLYNLTIYFKFRSFI